MENPAIWKSLADPTRRDILDQLRRGRKTTGELVNIYPSMGRCAVMKHLGLLEKSKLITVEREGRYRWNYLNAIPIQELYQRWVRKYERHWATGLINLKNTLENNPQTIMENQTTTIRINMQILINAPLEKTWNALVNDINLWWSKDFYTSPTTKEFILEPKVGGRMYEDYGNDNGLLWAEVIVLNKPSLLELKGHLTPQYGGPAVTFLKLQLSEDNGKTILNLSDTVMGEVTDKTKNDLEEGWKYLYGEGFKNYVEKL